MTNFHCYWLFKEDKDLYNKQIQSGGTVGYITSRLALVHPSEITNLSSGYVSSTSSQVFFSYTEAGTVV